MKDKRIIFMGTPIIATYYLNELIKYKFNVVSVFTQHPKSKHRGMKKFKSPVHECAIKNNINVFVPENFDTQTYEKIKNIKPDLIIVMAYGKILPKEILYLPDYGSVNVHVSLLPRWRGATPIEHAILNGDNETGISITKMNEKLDSGPILSQKKINIDQNINKEALSNKLTKLGTSLLIDTLPKYFESKINLIEQDEKLATYAKKFNSNMRKIDFFKSNIEVYNHIRGHAPFPGAWFNYKSERIKIVDAIIGENSGEPSTIINQNFEIACFNGSIIPKVLQRQGKNLVSCEEFIRGFNFLNGDILNA